jgi:RNA polymerase primary sigma factor
LTDNALVKGSGELEMETNRNQTGLQTYLQEIGTNRVLSKKEEVRLFQRIEYDDEAAREEILQCNLRLVVKIAMQYRGCGVSTSDLIQEGNLGLLNVITKFDWRKGFRFSTYAAFWIKQEIQAAIRQSNSMIRLPVRKARLMGKISETVHFFQVYEGREPTIEEIATFLGEDEGKIKMLMPYRDPIVSLDAERNEDGGNLMDTIAQVGPAPYEALDAVQITDTVQNVLEYLTDREREVIQLRFGLKGGQPLSLRKVSSKVGLSQEGVRRIERRALAKLQRPAIKSKLAGLAA